MTEFHLESRRQSDGWGIPVQPLPYSRSLLLKTYYAFKPFVPWQLRMAFRRLLARHLLRKHHSQWPIKPGSERKPANWPGWPEGKQFAFVLVHDVEGKAGLEKCRQLMELEERLGFRSGFFFIPEGNEYRVSEAFRRELVERGFEVGVHDLHHDGKLYSSREGFRRKAQAINGYLREWGAVGFRSGFMHHNLDWIHDLDIEYDGSTFDTDPFEPQPDGVDTIFPFWVPKPIQREIPCPGAAGAMGGGLLEAGSPPLRALGQGYIELPYTLPQDSTVFTLLKERGYSIWREKTEWIADHGGMAMVNVHPDFIAIGDRAPRDGQFPLGWYEGYLRSVKTRWMGDCWACLPRDVARFSRKLL